MKYCHSLNISHRDIKPGNIMFDQNPKTNKNPKLMVIDFGIAIKMDDHAIDDEYVGTFMYA